MKQLPRAPACQRNRDPILAVLKTVLARQSRVLEIGSGTGEHAVYFAQALPHLRWQTADLREYHEGISAWCEHAQLENLVPPVELDVRGEWPDARFDAVFTANTLHIMSWESVQALFARLPDVLDPGSRVVAYGPFNYGGRFTSESNAAFDASLRARDALMGIRDFEAVNALAGQAGLTLSGDQGMPANNRCLIWHLE